LALPGFVGFIFNDVYANCQEKFPNPINHGYEPQSKLWKQIPQQAAVFYTLRCAG
jgi:hypothetical protein